MNGLQVLALHQLLTEKMTLELIQREAKQDMPKYEVSIGRDGQTIKLKMLCCSAGIGQSVLPHGERFAVTTVTNFALDHKCKGK